MPARPRRHALIFGINYAGRRGIDALHGCLNDASYWTDTVRSMGFDVRRTLRESQCTREKMSAAIAKTVSAARTGDLVVICYSGHGTIVPPGVQSWVPYDFVWKAPSTWLTYDDLDRLLMEHEQRGVMVVVITDSCHSKADPRKHWRKLGRYPSRVRFLEPPPEIQKRIVSSPFRRNALTVSEDDLLLAAAQRDQTATDDYIDGAYRGAFTFALSEVLAGEPSLSYQAAVVKARAWLAENDYDQVPSANGSPAILRMRFFTTELGSSRATDFQRRTRDRSSVTRSSAPRTRSKRGRPSVVEPFRAAVAKMLRDNPKVRIQVVLERLRRMGYQGGRSALYVLVASLRQE